MKLRLIQVGLGGFGQDWYKRYITTSEDFELVAAVDVEPSMLACVQELGFAGERCYPSIEQALESVEADAVLITTTLAYHVPVALAALNAGLHVLTEKPFAPSVGEAEELVKLAAEKGLILAVSQNYRYFPAVRAVMDLIRENKFGRINTVNIDFRRYVSQDHPATYRHYNLVQPLLLDMSIHHFDLMRAVIGQEPVTVNCTTWNPAWSRYVEPPVGASTITFDGGAVVSYRGSWISAGPITPWSGEWRIDCEGGEIVWTSRADQGTGDDVVTVRPLGKRPRRLELPEMPLIDRGGTLHAFGEAIKSGQAPETAGEANIGSIALTFANIESATLGQPVRIG